MVKLLNHFDFLLIFFCFFCFFVGKKKKKKMKNLIIFVALIFFIYSSLGCTPIYPNCTCKTTTISCNDFNNMYNSISNKIDTFRPPLNETNSNEYIPVGKFIGKKKKNRF